MKVVLVHIAFRIIGIVLLSLYLFILFFYDGPGLFGILCVINMSFFVSVPYFFIEAYSLHQNKLKQKSRASLILGVLFLLVVLSFLYILIDGLV